MKKNIAVIFGGCSPEYGVSLQSAYAVVTHMDQSKYSPILIGISSAGDWYAFKGDPEKIAADTWCNSTDCIPALISPSCSDHGLLLLQNGSVEKIPLDAAFPVLHGKNGEDGTVQGLLALAGIPAAGCGVLSSALCMDKNRAHKLVSAAGISVPKSFVLEKEDDSDLALVWASENGYPIFVKPVRAGSSYGISKVSDSEHLLDAIELAFKYDNQVILEEYISGFEVGCAILGNDTLTIGEVDEIELTEGFFDFTEKYTLKNSAIYVPARISPDISDRIKQAARLIYKTLDCQGFARVDMFLSSSGRIVFNEVNTIPGFTSHSRFPGMMNAAGITFGQLVTSVIEAAVTL